MKVIVSVIKEIEMEIDSEALTAMAKDPMNDEDFRSWFNEAIADVERATGLRFGEADDLPIGVIDAVYTADGHIALMEW